MTPVNEEKLDSITIRIYPDEDPENPRKEFDHVGQMVCWHRRYNLGDKHSFADPDEFIQEAKRNKWEVLPLYVYEHGGITMSTGPFSCPWDSGQVGYFYITPDKGRSEWGRLWRKKARAYMEGEVKAYDQYLTGDVYGYVVTAPGGEESSCWGFYGLEYCMQEARSIAENMKLRVSLSEVE